MLFTAPNGVRLTVGYASADHFIVDAQFDLLFEPDRIMPEYRRWFVAGGTYFFTVVTDGRAKILTNPDARTLLRKAILETQTTRPFNLIAIVLLPDHLHAIWTLPENDFDFATRWAAIKARFSRGWTQQGGAEKNRSPSRIRQRRRGVWQRKYWEHLIRDETDFERHCDYIHYNPVKHGLSACPHEWEFSSFQRFVKSNHYDADWCCSCNGRQIRTPQFDGIDETAME